MEYLPAKSIVTRTKNTSWFGADYNMNIYRGCSHRCIYCDSRSECYRVDDFERVYAKKDALAIIGRELASKRKKGVVATGAMSDPYNPQEEKYRLTRGALKLLASNWFGVGIATKSALVVRDADVLNAIADHAPVIVKMTVTTCDDMLAEKIEPYAPLPSARLKGIEVLAKEGIFTGALMMPVLPFIEDNARNIVRVVEAAAGSGARFVFAGMGVTLRDRQRDWFYARLDESFPGISRNYKQRFGDGYQCGVRDYRKLQDAFISACQKQGLLYKMEDIILAYKSKYEQTQLKFL